MSALTPAPAREVDTSPTARAGNRTLRRFFRNHTAVVAAVVVLLLIVVAVLAPWITPHDPFEQDFSRRFASFSSSHWLGGDQFGRDVVSRLILGTRVSFVAAFQAVVVAVIIGMPLGIIAGYVGGFFDVGLSRIFDGLMSVPGLILAIAIVGVLGPDLSNAMLAIGIVFAPRFYRVARGATAEAKHETYVEGLRGIGCPRLRILWRHIMPNALSPVLVQASISWGVALIAEASLSYLGLGVRPPTPSLGGMLNNASSAVYNAPQQIFPPGIVIIITVLAVTLAVDGLRDALSD